MDYMLLVEPSVVAIFSRSSAATFRLIRKEAVVLLPCVYGNQGVLLVSCMVSFMNFHTEN